MFGHIFSAAGCVLATSIPAQECTVAHTIEDAGDRRMARSGMAAHLLIVSHTATGSTGRMLDAVVAGASSPGIDGVELRSVSALEATADDVRAADGILLGTPENFGYMSGALKHFFDTVFYDLGDETRGLPCGLFVKAGNDGTGAVASIEPLVTGLGWRRPLPPVVAVGELTAADLDACVELGATFAAGLAYGGL